MKKETTNERARWRKNRIMFKFDGKTKRPSSLKSEGGFLKLMI
jgi:hypothetical protein